MLEFSLSLEAYCKEIVATLERFSDTSYLSRLYVFSTAAMTFFMYMYMSYTLCHLSFVSLQGRVEKAFLLRERDQVVDYVG